MPTTIPKLYISPGGNSGWFNDLNPPPVGWYTVEEWDALDPKPYLSHSGVATCRDCEGGSGNGGGGGGGSSNVVTDMEILSLTEDLREAADYMYKYGCPFLTTLAIPTPVPTPGSSVQMSDAIMLKNEIVRIQKMINDFGCPFKVRDPLPDMSTPPNSAMTIIAISYQECMLAINLIMENALKYGCSFKTEPVSVSSLKAGIAGVDKLAASLCGSAFDTKTGEFKG